MSEITGNLKQDIKDLLNESANLVTSFFKRGICTVRAVADKWKAFAQDISKAVDTLMEPPFINDGPEAPAPSLDETAEPTVTIVESADGRFPVGLQLPLSQANELVGNADAEQIEAGRPPVPVKVKIDYILGGRTDRYWLPLKIGAGGGLLVQMQKHLDKYRTSPDKVAMLFDHIPEQRREYLRIQFTPVLEACLNELSTNILHHFYRHCDISTLDQQFQKQAMILPETEQRAFQQMARETIVNLRQAANTVQQQPAVRQEHERPAQREPDAPAAPSKEPRKQGERPIGSIKLKLEGFKRGQAHGGNSYKNHNRPKH